MTTSSQKTIKKLLIAIGIAVALLLVVTGFVSSQAPDKANAGSPPIVLTPLHAEPAEDANADDAAMAAKDKAVEKDKKDEKSNEKGTKDKKADQTKNTASEKKQTRKRSQIVKRVVTPSVTKKAESQVVATYGQGLNIKFKDLAALERLVGDDHIDIVLEYGDGTRFMLPEQFADETVVLNVPERAFSLWVSEKRVSELAPNEEMMNRLKVHRENTRYLAVLSADLRDAISLEAHKAGANEGRSVIVIDEKAGRPLVEFTLVRQ